MEEHNHCNSNGINRKRKSENGGLPSSVGVKLPRLRLEEIMTSKSDGFSCRSLVLKSPPENHQIFTIELIVLELLKHLTNEELIHCRRVNSHFCTVATQLLHHRGSLIVKLQYDWDLKQYVKQHNILQGSNSPVQHFTLASLTNLMKITTDFPSISFSFTGGTLSGIDIQEFLNFHGNRVRSLSIDVFSPTWNPTACNINIDAEACRPEMYLLKKLLLEQVPFLESMDIDSFPSNWKIPENSQLFSVTKEETLPNLKSVTFNPVADHHEPIVMSLLEAAVNLTSVKGCSNLLSLLKMNFNKCHLVKSLSWSPTPQSIEDCGPLLTKLTTSHSWNLQLRNFVLSLKGIAEYPESWPLVSEAIKCILQASCSTLETFTWGSSMGFFDDLVLPQKRLVKVVHVHIGTVGTNGAFWEISNQQIFPMGFQLTSAFPNLTSVTFALPRLTKVEEWATYFEMDLKPVLSVYKLHFDKNMFIPLKWMARFCQLFPNTTQLSVDTINVNILDMCRRGLWRFKRLNDLRLTIEVNSDDNRRPTLDSAFTGFKIEDLRNYLTISDLRHSPAELETESNLLTTAVLSIGRKQTGTGSQKALDLSRGRNVSANDLPVELSCRRENESILNLKGLETVHLHFLDTSNFSRTFYADPFTHVTDLYGLALCPRLARVDITCQAYQKENMQRLEECMAMSTIGSFARLRNKIIKTVQNGTPTIH